MIARRKVTKEIKASREKQKSGIGSRNQDGFKVFFLLFASLLSLIFCCLEGIKRKKEEKTIVKLKSNHQTEV